MIYSCLEKTTAAWINYISANHCQIQTFLEFVFVFAQLVTEPDFIMQDQKDCVKCTLGSEKIDWIFSFLVLLFLDLQ